MSEAGRIDFRSLEHADLPLMHEWLGREHVRTWWSDHPPTPEQVAEHYGPKIDGGVPTRPFLILLDGRPIGYAQAYRIEDHPDYARAVDAGPGAGGLDLFIGEPELLSRGLGPRIVESFLTGVLFADPEIDVCVIGPSVENRAAIRAYAKAGFTHLKTVQVPGERLPEYLMTRRR